MRNKYFTHVAPRLEEIENWLKDNGLTEAQVCKNLGVSRSSFNEYKNKYPDLVDTIKKGKRVNITEIENALMKRALGYEYQEIKTYVKYEGGKETTYTEKTQKHMAPDTAACAILLKNKDPQNYTNDRALLDFKRQELEVRKMLEEAKNW